MQHAKRYIRKRTKGEYSLGNMHFRNFISYLLHLADTNLVLAQRNAEWCSHGPVLEQDIAITNISLDLLGQARNFYQYAALIINKEPDSLAASEMPGISKGTSWVAGTASSKVSEDALAYLRTE